MVQPENIRFIDNPAIQERSAAYLGIVVDTAQILKSWQISLFSFEWLLPDGRIRTLAELSEAEKPKRARVEELIRAGTPIEKPILGIGIMDNVEIGSGRAEFLTLVAHGIKTIPVHIPKTNQSDFKEFLADIDSA